MNIRIVNLSLLIISLFTSTFSTQNINKYLSDFKSDSKRKQYNAINSFFKKYDTNSVNMLMSEYNICDDSLKPYIINAIGILQEPKAYFFLSEQEFSENYNISEASRVALNVLTASHPLHHEKFHGGYTNTKPLYIPAKCYNTFRRRKGLNFTFSLTTIGLFTYSVFGTGFLIYKRMSDEDYYRDKKDGMWPSVAYSLGAGMVTLGFAVGFYQASYKGVNKKYNTFLIKKKNKLETVTGGKENLINTLLSTNVDSLSKAILYTISSFKSEKDINELFEIIKHNNFDREKHWLEISQLFDAISIIKSPLVTKWLIQLITNKKHKNLIVRNHCVDALGERKETSATQYILAALKNMEISMEIARNSLNSLDSNWTNTIEAKNLIPLFIDLLESGSRFEKLEAIKFLILPNFSNPSFAKLFIDNIPKERIDYLTRDLSNALITLGPSIIPYIIETFPVYTKKDKFLSSMEPKLEKTYSGYGSHIFYNVTYDNNFIFTDETTGITKRSYITILKCYLGAYVLSKLTGVECGNDKEKWEKWWFQNKDSYYQPGKD